MDLLTLMETLAVRTQFPLFAPPPPPRRPATEIRFSRWNNANAQKFIQPKTTQKQLEDKIRFDRRFDSVLTIANTHNPAPPHPTPFKSAGTPSSPSPPSIPGKKSKYSKTPPQKTLHPAFKPLAKPRKIPGGEDDTRSPAGPNFRVDENGVSYEMPEAPFVYQYSYTETPKAKPVKLREPLVSPFGPPTLAKPWLGRKPLPPSKKKLPEFDSFQLPPPHKKGVKPVQAPGPFLPGSGPKYVRSRAEVLGEPLSKDEIEKLVEGCKKDRRQLNMGRDGLTHNMLENVHALWKRRRVCKIKCKGVCTVDMDNVAEQLEEKTGGKIIYRRDGIIYLFRGRNYNFKSRPRFPLMLWKPITPVYPRLVQRVPEDLTLEEVSDMRKRGRDLTPICKLAKNGVYCKLVENVREAFGACELVRINCQGLNPSDYKKIGAKLKDLVPCVLLSFEGEHILMWRGRDWKSSIVSYESLNGLQQVKADGVDSAKPLPSVSSQEILTENGMDESLKSSVTLCPRDDHPEGVDQILGSETCDKHPEGVVDSEMRDNHPAGLNQTVGNEMTLDGLEELERTVGNSDIIASVSSNTNDHMKVDMQCTEGIILLRKEAVENGMAFVLDEGSLDADSVFRKAVAFAKTAPTGPVFRQHRAKKAGVETKQEQESGDSRVKDGAVGMGTEISVSRGRKESKIPRSQRMEEIKGDYLNVVPQGSLRVDELAKLLA